jgi:hypothetical protein
MSAPKISATPQPLRPLQFQERTFTAPIISQFDTFNQTLFVAAFRNTKAGNLDRHHPRSMRFGKMQPQKQALKSIDLR